MRYYFRENVRRYETMADQGFENWANRIYGGSGLPEFSTLAFMDLALPKLRFESDLPTALELGTGVGPGAVYLAKRGFQVTGYDVIPEAIMQARAIASNLELDIEYSVQDVTAIAHEGPKFDLIVDTYCINHVVFAEERTSVFESVKARLKPDGYYLVTSSMYDSDLHRPEHKVTDEATGTVYDHYGDECLYDPATGYHYEVLEKRPSKREETESCSDVVDIDGKAYIPLRCYRDGEGLRAELASHGFEPIFHYGVEEESTICVDMGSGTVLAYSVEVPGEPNRRSTMADVATVSEQLAELVEGGFTKDAGSIEAIFIRPVTEEREELQEAELLKAEGVKGDRWQESGHGPRNQITMMNARVLDCVSGGRDQWAPAGDQLIVDLDVSEANLPVGQRLQIGDAVVEVTEVPHTGCAKFRRRYGAESLDYINSEGLESLRLRGVYVMVIEEGAVRAGDTIKKI